jgi:hypothetical protein
MTGISDMSQKILVVAIVLLLCPMIANALMPPRDIEKHNLDAEVIAIGKVLEMGQILLPLEQNDSQKPKGLFVLEVHHVIKGFAKATPGQPLRVIYPLPPKVAIGLDAVIAGNPPVEVAVGDVVLVFLKSTPQAGFYQPVLAGSSVCNVNKPGRSLQPPEPEPKAVLPKSSQP